MENARITMMRTISTTMIDGRVLINGTEWVIQPFEVEKGASATEKENALLKQAISEWRTRLDARESRLMDWMQGAGQ